MATATEEEPRTDRVWSIETNGINPIPDSERHGKPFELFWIWCASNIAILGVVYGVTVVSFRVNLWQALVAGVVGTVLSFLLVGYISLAGKRGGAPTLILSRASFGVRGNALPTVVSYLALVGWETVLVSLATLATETVLDRLGVATSDLTTALAFALIATVTIAGGLLGHATIVRIQMWFTWAFAALTVVFFLLELDQIRWADLGDLHGGSFVDAFVPATVFVMASLGIGWVNAAADYSRYLPRSSSSQAVVGWTVFGASVAPILLIAFGILLASRGTDLAFSANPIGDLAEPLPTWFLVPYMIVAAGGLVAGALLDIYSSGLNLLALGVRLERYKTVAIDGALMVLGAIYILFVADDFLTPFIAFLLILGIPLSAWSAIFLTDMWLYHRRTEYSERDLYDPAGTYGSYNLAALGSFLLAVFVGLSLTKNFRFTWVGWWARGIFENSLLGLLVAFAIAALLYAVLSRVFGPREGAPR